MKRLKIDLAMNRVKASWKLTLVLGTASILLTGCLGGDIFALTQSQAYKVGYKVAKELKSTGDSVDSYLNNLASWIDDKDISKAVSENSFSSQIATFDKEGCTSLWKIVGISNALLNYTELENTPNNKKDFVRGCMAGGKG